VYIKTNYHTHCFLDDGAQKPELYAEQALKEGFSVLGFSCHAPLPFPNQWTLKQEDLPRYIRAVREVQELYRGRLEICLGLEVDYVPGRMGPSSDWVQALDLDYRIGSIHMLEDPETGEYLSVDGPDSEFLHLLEKTFRGDIREMVRAYFRQEIRLMEEHEFQILGHCDLMKKKNRDSRYFNQDEPWYREAAMELLETAARKKVILEVNTGAIARGYQTEFYPSPWMLARAFELGIPATLNSDAHQPEKISAAFTESLSIIREAGYSELSILKDGSWQSVPI